MLLGMVKQVRPPITDMSLKIKEAQRLLFETNVKTHRIAKDFVP